MGNLFSNVEDQRKPFLSMLFAIISLSTASFVYLSVDGHSAINQCHNISLLAPTNRTTTDGAATTTAAPAPALFHGGHDGFNGTTTTEGPAFKIIEVNEYRAAVTGGIVICALLAASAISIVLSVYCRSASVLKVSFGLFMILVVALVYPLIVFSQSLSVGYTCREVGLRLVPSSIGLIVAGVITSLFFTETLGKIRVGDDAASRTLLPQ